MTSMNWARAHTDRRMRDRGSETTQGVATPARRITRPRSDKPAAAKEPSQRTLAEVDKFWRDRSGRAIVTRLTEFKGHALVDLRTFYTAADGTMQPGKGLACGVRLLPQLARSVAKAVSEAQRLGLLPAGGGEA